MQPLDENKIRSKIKNQRFGRNFHYFESIPSTNTLVKELIQAGKEISYPVVAFAEEQTGGKGRIDRKWISPVNKGIWMTIAFPPVSKDFTFGHYNFIMSMSVASAVESCTGLEATYKWPNDIQISGKKICGILSEKTENRAGDSVMIVGAGLNVNILKEEFPEDLREKATSLMIETGKEIDRSGLFIELLDSLNNIFELWEYKGIIPIFHAWNKKCTTPGKMITIKTSKVDISGKAEFVKQDGSLVITDSLGQTRTIYAGDIDYMVNGE